MNGGFAVSPYASSVVCQPRIPSISQQRYLNSSRDLALGRSTPSQPLFCSLPNFTFCRHQEVLGFNFRCNSSTNPEGSSGPEENDTKAVLDAFFLGKALAEALSERVESTVGEFLSTIGRLQAEQQKQVQDFQGEVLERAKKAKERAAREAMEPQGLVSRSSFANEFKDQSNNIASQAKKINSSSSSVQPAKSNSGSAPADPLPGQD